MTFAVRPARNPRPQFRRKRSASSRSSARLTINRGRSGNKPQRGTERAWGIADAVEVQIVSRIVAVEISRQAVAEEDIRAASPAAAADSDTRAERSRASAQQDLLVDGEGLAMKALL